jgi:flagellar biosynthesis component FlhA
MVSIHTFRPLDFSSFPTVLLFATILSVNFLNLEGNKIGINREKKQKLALVIF